MAHSILEAVDRYISISSPLARVIGRLRIVDDAESEAA